MGKKMNTRAFYSQKRDEVMRRDFVMVRLPKEYSSFSDESSPPFSDDSKRQISSNELKKFFRILSLSGQIEGKKKSEKNNYVWEVLILFLILFLILGLWKVL